MGMPAQGQGHARRDLREDIRLMRHQDHGIIAADGTQHLGEIIDAARHAAIAPMQIEKRNLIAKTGEPETVTPLGDMQDIVFVEPDSHLFERLAGLGRPATPAHRLGIAPPIVVAEHGMHAKRRFQRAQKRAPFSHRHIRRTQAHAGDVIAEQHDDIAAEGIGCRDDFLPAPQVHPRFAEMEIGERHDAQRRPARPILRGESITLRPEAIEWLDRHAIGAHQPTEREGACQSSQKMAAGEQIDVPSR